jgi:hypothetical protein
VPSTNTREGSVAGFLAEYDFIGAGMRQYQRERHGFLAFALTASGLILGLLMRSNSPRSATEACFLIGLTAGATLIAERMTIHTSQAIAAGDAYVRLFIEPYIDGLALQRRLASPLRSTKLAVPTRNLGLAYTGLTAAFVLAWPAVPIDGSIEWWQTLIVAVLGATSLFHAMKLYFMGCPHSLTTANACWNAIYEEERRTSGLDTSSGVSQTHLPQEFEASSRTRAVDRAIDEPAHIEPRGRPEAGRQR